MTRLCAAIRYHAARDPDRLAVTYAAARISYRVLYQRVTAVGAFLSGRGLAAGAVVGLLMKNSAAFLELAIGCTEVGAILLPINYRLARNEVAYILDHSKCAFVFVDAELEAMVQGLVPHAVVSESARADSGDCVGAAVAGSRATGSTIEAVFRLMYTSGTTARPKGVMHTYSNFVWKCLDHIIALGLTASDRLLVCGPLYHVGAFDLPGLAVLLCGGSLHVLRDFDAVQAVEIVQTHRITGAWMAPVMLQAFLQQLAQRNPACPDLAWIIGGGERTPEQRIREFATLLPTTRYIDAYGLTETCSGDTLMEPGTELRKIGSVGRALPHVEIEIRRDNQLACAPGEEGEICLRGPKVTPGYLNDPQATVAALATGWLRTGDVGYLDPDGFLYITDRKKDMILSGGENIASSEIERVVGELAQVADVAAFGLPDERWGERVAVAVVVAQGKQLSYEELERHCRQQLAGFKVPRQLFVRGALPRNASGKLLKRVLRAELSNEVGERATDRRQKGVESC